MVTFRLSALLHVDPAPESRAFGNRHAGRYDITLDGPVVPNGDLFASLDVSNNLAKNDDRLCKHFRADATVRPDRQKVLLQLDLAFNLSLNR